MEESAPLRRSAVAGLFGVAFVTLGIGLVAGSPPPDASTEVIVNHLADDEDHVRSLLCSLFLVPGFALLLWFAAALRSVLAQMSSTDRLPSIVLPGMAVFATAGLGGQALTAAPAVAAAVTRPEVVDPAAYRLFTVAGLFLALGGLAGAAVLVAATSRVAGEAGSLPLVAEVGGYLVAVTCALGYFGYGVAVPLLLLWLTGACIAVWRFASRRRTGDVGDTPPGSPTEGSPGSRRPARPVP
ncbi:MAG: hypothetical protein ACRDYU_11225 [Actinomycetes bacterium]